MTTILLTITIVSLILTVALAALVVKLTRDERRRSAARVAALARMADTASADNGDSFELDETDDNDLTFDRLEQAPRAGELFAAHESPHSHSEWPHRLGIVVAVAVVVAIATVAVRWRSIPIVPSTTERIAGTAPSAQAPGLLELMSLKHAQDGTTLTITGLVQNPRDGVPLTKVAATAYVFGADGSFITSGSAPLDFTLLRPGAESPFTISVPVAAAVARYRVGFRDEGGRIIGHVDRRGSSTIAAATIEGSRIERGPS
jgi:hypothetical protein